MRKFAVLSMLLVLLIACTCQVPPFLSGLLGGGKARGEMIRYDDIIENTMAADGFEYWSFSGRRGDQISIRMDSNDMDSFLVLFGPAGNFLTYDDDGGGDLNATIGDFVLADAGIHNIVATSYGGGDRGDYTLVLERVATNREPAATGGGTLQYGDAIQGDLLVRTVDVWMFSGEAGDRVTISLQSDDFDTVLEVWGPDLMPATQNDDGGDGTDSLIEGFVLPESGIYNIIARGYGDRDVGSYMLSLDSD